MTFWEIFQGFLADLLNSALNDFLAAMDGVIGNLLYSTFFIESLPGLDDTALSTSSIQSAVNVMYGFMVLLLAAKLIWKGIKVYILWRDGDAETDPGEMLIGAVFAIIVAVAFPLLYEIGVEVVQEMSDSICTVLFAGNDFRSNDYISLVRGSLSEGVATSFVIIFLALVFVILFIIMLFIMLKQGAEMFVFRLGVPIAVIGLIDSDGGAWKPYSQTLFRQMATALVRYVCMLLGVRLMIDLTLTGLLLGIVFEIVAISTPMILSQFLSPKGGGGISQKLYTIGMAVRMFGGG